VNHTLLIPPSQGGCCQRGDANYHGDGPTGQDLLYRTSIETWIGHFARGASIFPPFRGNKHHGSLLTVVIQGGAKLPLKTPAKPLIRIVIRLPK
jgi:hypothetical protein